MKEKMSNIKKAVLPSVLVAVTFFVFGSFEMYFANQTEFWFAISDILLPCIISAVIAVAVLLFLTFAIECVQTKAVPITVSLIFSLGLALYIQGNYMVMDYGVLDGKTIQWENYTVYGIINTLVWIVCIAAPLVLLRVRPKWFELVTKYVPIFILAVQVITLGVLFVTNDISKQESAVFTTENEFELSKDKNVIVFIVDSLDVSYVDNMLEEFPEVRTAFKDFTYFNDVCGAYSSTRGSVPYILSGYIYLNSEPHRNYLKKAYEEGPIFQAANKSGYEIDIYTGSMFAVPMNDNPITNLEVVETGIDSLPAFIRTYFQLVAFRYVPHFAKNFFWMYSSEFDAYMKVLSDTPAVSGMGYIDNISFYRSLNASSLVDSRESPVMKVYHLGGTHVPLSFDENLNLMGSAETSPEKQARGVFRILEEYIQQLHEVNLYESTSIVIMADHGTIYEQCPALLVKKANSQHSQLEINTAPVSYVTDWPNSIISLLNNDEELSDLFSVPNNTSRVRTFYRYTWDGTYDAEYLPDIYEYKFVGKAKEMSTENDFTGTIYKRPDDSPYHYEIGNICEISDTSFFSRLSQYGMIPSADGYGRKYAWLENESKMQLILSDTPERNLKLLLKIYSVNGYDQRVEILINGSSIGETVFTLGEEEKSVLIPLNLITGKDIAIEFRSPDAIPYGSNPVPVSVAITSFQLTETETAVLAPETYPAINEATKFVFDGATNYDDIITVRGVYPVLGTAAWSSEKARFYFCTDIKTDLLFTINYGTYYTDFNAIVSYNGTEIGRLTNSHASVTLTLPKELMAEDGPQVIELFVQNATSPKLYGYNPKDTRILGLCISSISIEPYIVPIVNSDVIVDYQNGPVELDKIRVKGIYAQQGTGGAWTSDTMELLFNTETEEDILFNLTYGTYYEDFEAIVSFNGTEIERLTKSHASVSITLPKELMVENDPQLLTIVVPAAVSPKVYGYGDSQDERVLGICISSFSLTFE